MAKLIIKRSNEFMNRMRTYGIYIDGQKVDTISNSQVNEINVSPGRHSIISKIDWCSSPEITFDINDNEVKTFKVGAFKYANWVLIFAIVILALSYILKRTQGTDYFIYLIFPLFLLLIYFLTFGRKKYLSLKEMDDWV